MVVPTIIHFLDHFNWILISQLIKGISSVLQKLLIFFNGTIILTSFMPPFPTCPVIFCLKLNEVQLLLSLGKSKIVSLISKLVHLYIQLACSIPGIFAECSLSVAMLRISKEHLGNILKEKNFFKVFDEKVVFVLKVSVVW